MALGGTPGESAGNKGDVSLSRGAGGVRPHQVCGVRGVRGVCTCAVCGVQVCVCGEVCEVRVARVLEEITRRSRNAEPQEAALYLGPCQWLGFYAARGPRTRALGTSLASLTAYSSPRACAPATGDPDKSHRDLRVGLSARGPVHTSLLQSVWVHRRLAQGGTPRRGVVGMRDWSCPACCPVCRAVGQRICYSRTSCERCSWPGGRRVTSKSLRL